MFPKRCSVLILGIRLPPFYRKVTPGQEHDKLGSGECYGLFVPDLNLSRFDGGVEIEKGNPRMLSL